MIDTGVVIGVFAVWVVVGIYLYATIPQDRLFFRSRLRYLYLIPLLFTLFVVFLTGFSWSSIAYYGFCSLLSAYCPNIVRLSKV